MKIAFVVDALHSSSVRVMIVYPVSETIASNALEHAKRAISHSVYRVHLEVHVINVATATAGTSEQSVLGSAVVGATRLYAIDVSTLTLVVVMPHTVQSVLVLYAIMEAIRMREFLCSLTTDWTFPISFCLSFLIH